MKSQRFLAVLLACVPSAGQASADEAGQPPSLELLEYLAEFVDNGDGRWVDPLDALPEGDHQPAPNPEPRRAHQ